jgi:predicted ArsR family transcriptional regulator
MKTTTRNRILEMLEKQRTATVAQLSRTLQVTQADIRHHLSQLSTDGWVEIAAKDVTGERGRPRQVYRLTTSARRDNLPNLAKALLWAGSGGDQHEFIQRAADFLAGPMPEWISQQPVGRRLIAAVQRLNDLHYQAHWEAHARAPQIRLGNCPYATILPEHPELCQIDALLLEKLTSSQATQTARLEPTPQGAMVCIFLLETKWRGIKPPENNA